MRYDNWDIILFPEDSNIPIPEYKTACYLSRDEDGHELPILRTYIGSLKPDTPFRISVHHWGPPKPSPLMQEARRLAGLDITFTVQVLIDGTSLYFGDLASITSSPQEIAYEQRTFRSSRSKERPTSQPKQRLIFPRSDKNALLQTSAWQPRGTDNRVKIILSERLVNSEGALESGNSDIVCFTFQHAPRDLLEQAGIAYPIIDPLRSLVGERATFKPSGAPRNTLAREIQRGARVHADLSPEPDDEPVRPPNPEPYQQPARRPSVTAYPPQFIGHRGGGHHPNLWNNPYGHLGDDDTSMGSWPSQRTTSTMSGLHYYDAPFPPYTVPPWPHNTAVPAQRTASNVNSTRSRKENDTQQVMMAFRDDQFGQIMEAISPSKKQRDKTANLPSHPTQQQDTQTHRPPKMAALSVPVRPSSAAIARSNASSDMNAVLQHNAKRPPSDQTNFSTKSRPKSGSYMQHHDGKKPNSHSRTSEQNPFVREPQRWDSDISMREDPPNSSMHSRHQRRPASLNNKLGSAHAPSAVGEVKGRKEGLATNTINLLDTETRHDQSLLPALNVGPSTRVKPSTNNSEKTPTGRQKARHAGASSEAEIIDVDAIDPNLAADTIADLAKLSPFEPGHKANMSSISSTGRLERQLYSALGEELGSFEQQMNMASMGPELAQALSGTATRNERSDSAALDPTVSEFEPAAKRKREGAFGGERGSSPLKKKEKAQKATVEDEMLLENMPRLRGD